MAEPTEAEPVEPTGAQPVAETGSGPQPAGSRLRSYAQAHRGKLAIALAVTTAAVLAGTAIGVFDARTEPAGVTGPAPSLAPSTPADYLAGLPLPAAEDGGELRIVDSGFSAITDAAGEPLVTWGLVVENTSRVTAAAVQVSLDILDEAGASLVTEISDYAKSRAISVVMPGERAGIGDATYVTGPEVAEVTFRLGDPQWWSLDNPVHPVAPLTTSDIEVSQEEPAGFVPYWDEEGIRVVEATEGNMILQFRVDSGYDHILEDPSAQAIFRDEHAAIVGGTHPGDTDVHATVPPGWSIQRIRVKYGPPAHADLSRTEVYAYPSCC